MVGGAYVYGPVVFRGCLVYHYFIYVSKNAGNSLGTLSERNVDRKLTMGPRIWPSVGMLKQRDSPPSAMGCAQISVYEPLTMDAIKAKQDERANYTSPEGLFCPRRPTPSTRPS
jgi:hypothetical protein